MIRLTPKGSEHECLSHHASDCFLLIPQMQHLRLQNYEAHSHVSVHYQLRVKKSNPFAGIKQQRLYRWSQRRQKSLRLLRDRKIAKTQRLKQKEGNAAILPTANETWLLTETNYKKSLFRVSVRRRKNTTPRYPG